MEIIVKSVRPEQYGFFRERELGFRTALSEPFLEALTGKGRQMPVRSGAKHMFSDLPESRGLGEEVHQPRRMA